MASRLLNTFKAPAMVIASSDKGDLLTGSMRSPKGFDIPSFYEKFGSILETYGGHANAGGFSVKRENVDKLIAKMSNLLDYMDCVEEPEECVDIDCTIPKDFMNLDLIKIAERFEPYGQSHAPIVFHIQGATVTDYSYISGGKNGNRNIKLTLSYGEFAWPCVFWNGADHVGKDFDKNTVVDCVFRLNRNYFNYQEIIQLIILDIKQTGIN
jgi:single-stranded-DNA-specific exonuclease